MKQKKKAFICHNWYLTELCPKLKDFNLETFILNSKAGKRSYENSIIELKLWVQFKYVICICIITTPPHISPLIVVQGAYWICGSVSLICFGKLPVIISAAIAFSSFLLGIPGVAVLALLSKSQVPLQVFPVILFFCSHCAFIWTFSPYTPFMQTFSPYAPFTLENPSVAVSNLLLNLSVAFLISMIIFLFHSFA